MVVNNGTGSVTVFDLGTDTVVGSVTVGSGVLDCSINAQANLGYVGDFATHIFAIDLSTPGLAGGTNPIITSIATEDTTVTADGKFLLTCDGSNFQPVSVVDLTSRTEASTFPLMTPCTGVEACSDGSVLTVEYGGTGVRRLTIDLGGNLSDTGDALPLPNAFNAICGKGASVGIALTGSGTIQSFTIPGLTPVDTRNLASTAISAVLNGAGDRLYVRSGVDVEVFSFDSTTGAIGATPMLTIPVTSAGTYYGVDQLALNGAGTKLYVSENSVVNVYDASSGGLLTTITDPAMSSTTGLCATPSVCGNGIIEGGEACDDMNLVDGDGCDSNCTVTACGNGIVTMGEACDDGNTNNGDCCSNSCTPAPDATPCDDLQFCNGTDSCLSGACTAHSGDPCSGGPECNDTCSEATDSCARPNGTGCTDDGNVCTFDVCDGLGTCTHPGNFFVPCDDGVFCNGADTCYGGSCDLHNGDPCQFFECNTVCDEIGTQCDPTGAGTACTDDGNECTGDQCDGLGSCGHPSLPNTTSCTDDGNQCTNDKCNGTGACAHPAVVNGTDCDDDNACTQTDQCQSGNCVGSDLVQCTAGLCTVAGSCDPISGDCVNCPGGYSPGGGGCQKTYAIDVAHLDNLDQFCDGTGDHRYNTCDTTPWGFHWTDSGDGSVGPVNHVDVQLNQGLECHFADHPVSLNGDNVATLVPGNECSCVASTIVRNLTNLDATAYVKSGLNTLRVSTVNCGGLNNDNGVYASVTVTYDSPPPLPAVETSCGQAGKSKLKYKNNSSDAKDKLKWKWGKGDAAMLSDFSDPTASAEYRLCIFRENGGSPALLIGAEVPSSNSLWSAIGSSGFKYLDSSAAQGGVRGILVRAGAAGKSKALVKGQGTQLSDPTLPLGPDTTGIRVQLTNQSNGKCWESEFPLASIKADDAGFKATH